MAGGYVFSFLSRKWTAVYRESHLDGRFADLNEGKGLGSIDRGDGISDRNPLCAREADNVAYSRFFNLTLGETFKLADGYYSGFFRRHIWLVIVGYINLLILLDGSAFDSADSHTSNVIVVVDGGNEKLELSFLIAFGSGHIFNDSIKQRL